MSQKTETHWLHNHSGNGFPSYEIYFAWRNVHIAHNRDHWITRLGPSGKCEAGPILALSGACRWRTSVISRKKLAKDACKAGCLPIEMPSGVKAFRFVNMPKPQHLPHDLLYHTDRVSTTIQAQDTQYKDVSSMTGPCIGTYWLLYLNRHFDFLDKLAHLIAPRILTVNVSVDLLPTGIALNVYKCLNVSNIHVQ